MSDPDPDIAERWALWPDGVMCPADEVEAMLRAPFAFSDDFQWVWVVPDDDDDLA